MSKFWQKLSFNYLSMKKKLSKKEKEKLKCRAEEPYHFQKKMCMTIAYDLKIKLIEENSMMYYEKDGKRALLCKPTHPKKLWFETLEALGEMKPHFKNYFEEVANIHIPRKNPSDK